MNNFIFQNATKVYFGKGCVKEYLSCLTSAARTVMLAYGGGSIKRNGIYDEVTKILRDAGKTIVEFPGIMANPTYAKVQAGAKLAREAGVDMILGVGGGSVMDCCKAISLAARYRATSGRTSGRSSALSTWSRCRSVSSSRRRAPAANATAAPSSRTRKRRSRPAGITRS